MQKIFLAVVVVLAWFVFAEVRADESIPPEMVTAVKATTVYIKIEVEGLSGSGSGFVIKTEGDSAYVVSNYHVVEPKAVEVIRVPSAMPDVTQPVPRKQRPTPGVPRPIPGVRQPMPGQPRSPYAPYPQNPYAPVPRSPYDPVPRSPYAPSQRNPYAPPRAPYAPEPQYRSPSYTNLVIVRSFKNVVVTVIFNSGTKKEDAIRGEVLCVDPEQDLALIKVSGVKELPKPIDYLHETKLVETMPVYTFGYPFGKFLATSKGSPAVTVGKGSISSLRLDDDGELAIVQIDGAMNPGNSGGPVVDAQGKLIGIAVATIKNSSGIGLAIPARAIHKMLQGRIMSEGYLSSSQDAAGVVTIQVEVGLVDPMNKIKSATLHYLVGNTDKNKLKPTDSLEKEAECRTLPLKIEKQIAKGEITLKKEDVGKFLSYQTVYVNDAGKKALTNMTTESVKVKPPKVAKSDSARPQQLDTSFNDITRDKNVTDILGGSAEPRFADAAPEKGVLIGLEVGLAKYRNNDVVRSVRPIFQNAKGEEVLGNLHGVDISRVVKIKAKKGFAVAGLTASAGRLVNGLSVTFMRIDQDHLDPKETYDSDWVGSKGVDKETKLGGDGSLVVGIIGRKRSKYCNGLGLMTVAANKPDAQAAVTEDKKNITPGKPATAATEPVVQGTETKGGS